MSAAPRAPAGTPPASARAEGTPRPLLVVVGPTASGKTALAVELAERLGGEVVGADSVQVYRHFDLGAGKPDAATLARAPHHLIDVVEPDQPLDAASWAERASAVVSAVEQRGAVPVVCGGSFLWVKSLLFGLSPLPAGNPALRAEHEALAAEHGRAFVHERLRAVDPRSAERLAPNDLVRVSRALEVHQLTGVPLSAWHAQHGFAAPTRPFLLVGVRRERDELAARITRRVDAMLEAGWVAEVERLIAAGWGESRPMGSVGYRQIHAALTTGADASAEALREPIARATRVFVRRQLTWLREQPVRWVSPGEGARLAADVVRARR